MLATYENLGTKRSDLLTLKTEVTSYVNIVRSALISKVYDVIEFPLQKLTVISLS